MEFTKNVTPKHVDTADEITVIKNSVQLFEMKYGKYMDKNALDSLRLITKQTEKLEKKLN